MSLNPFTLSLPGGKQVPAVRVAPGAPLQGLRSALGLPRLGGAIAIVGGAASFDQPEYHVIRERTRQLLNALAGLTIQHRLSVVDGGTPFGAMKLAGQICYSQQYRFPLVGVAPTGRVAWSTQHGISYPETWFAGMDVRAMIARQKAQADELAPLDEHHAAFVLVEADEWGGETEMLARVAQELAAPEGHMLEILINGGAVARKDVAAFVQLGGQVLVMAGSGRFADELAAAMQVGHSPEADMQALLDSGRLQRIHINDAPPIFLQKVAELGGWS